MPTAATWPTATSSPRTSSCPPTATRCFLTSTWPATGRPLEWTCPRATLAALLRTWPPNAYKGWLAMNGLKTMGTQIKRRSSYHLISSWPYSDRTHKRHSSDPQERGPHQADIYSLGMVLLEALTGEPPAQAAMSGTTAGGTDFDQLRAIAGAYASSRGRGATLAIRESEQCGRRAITPGLRAILARCLDPDPDRRYRRGLELAEDLDRWRMDRPLAYTSEPFWGQIVPRVLRRQRRTMILTAAILSILVGLPTTAVVMLGSRKNLEAAAQYKLSRHWDDPDSPTYGLQRPGSPRVIEQYVVFCWWCLTSAYCCPRAANRQHVGRARHAGGQVSREAVGRRTECGRGPS